MRPVLGRACFGRFSPGNAQHFASPSPSLAAGREEKRVAVRAPMRPEICHITHEFERNSGSSHAKHFTAFALWTILVFADVLKIHGVHLASRAFFAVTTHLWIPKAESSCRARWSNFTAWAGGGYSRYNISAGLSIPD